MNSQRAAIRKHQKGIALVQRMTKLKARIMAAGLKQSDFPPFVFDLAEVEEMMDFYTPYTSANRKLAKVMPGNAVMVLGFRGIAFETGDET